MAALPVLRLFSKFCCSLLLDCLLFFRVNLMTSFSSLHLGFLIYDQDDLGQDQQGWNPLTVDVNTPQSLPASPPLQMGTFLRFSPIFAEIWLTQVARREKGQG